MTPIIRTRVEVARWIAIQTAYAAAFILPATAAACLWLCGGDLSRAIGGWEAMRFILGLALAETLLFTPIVAIRSVETLRQLNLARDELDRLTGVDPLTGLLNRRGFEKAAADLSAATEARDAPVAALVCDVD
ncbi:MAG: GGDEF domain-containing protein, partial [Roseiarcus sp.]